MSAFGGLKQTNAGSNLQMKAQLGIPLQFTRIAIGDGEISEESIPDLEVLVSEKKSLEITKLKIQSEHALVGTVVSNQEIEIGFDWREVGLFADDPDLGEILYCYANAGENSEYIPAGGGADIIEKSIDLFTIIGEAESVTATIDHSLVFETLDGSKEKADRAESNANTYTDTHANDIDNPHFVTTEQIDAIHISQLGATRYT